MHQNLVTIFGAPYEYETNRHACMQACLDACPQIWNWSEARGHFECFQFEFADAASFFVDLAPSMKAIECMLQPFIDRMTREDTPTTCKKYLKPKPYECKTKNMHAWFAHKHKHSPIHTIHDRIIATCKDKAQWLMKWIPCQCHDATCAFGQGGWSKHPRPAKSVRKEAGASLQRSKVYFFSMVHPISHSTIPSGSMLQVHTWAQRWSSWFSRCMVYILSNQSTHPASTKTCRTRYFRRAVMTLSQGCEARAEGVRFTSQCGMASWCQTQTKPTIYIYMIYIIMHAWSQNCMYYKPRHANTPNLLSHRPE